ncbi:MAG: hypothetical protein KAU94_11200 [Verrucomicrobia bacterium]|nr:hypothetical protein [Verrucomicrobiota bacterium]
MKWIKGICLAVVVGLFAGNAAMAGSEIEKPAVLDDALLTVTVSDLHGLIDGAGTVASQISPMMNGMMLKSMIGMQIGDPGLAGIAPGKGLAVVALDPTNAFALIEMSEAQFPSCTNALAVAGMKSKYSNGLLIVGDTDEEITKGSSYADAVKSILLAKRSPTLRIALKPSESIAKNDEKIQGLLQMMPMMMGMGLQQNPGTSPEAIKGITKVLEGEVRILLSLANQIESAEITLAPANGSIRINEVYSPVPGSNLADFCNSPKVNQWNPKLHSGLLGEGAIQIDFCFANPEALSSLYMTEADQLVKEMKLDAEQVKPLMDSMKKWMAVFGGTGCESIFSDDETSLGASVLMEVKDEAVALELLKTMQADMAVITDLYKSFGMQMVFNFKENVREHAGVKIHQLKMNMSMEQISATEQEQFEAMGLTNMQYEIAITDGIMAYAMGEGGIERLIDQIKEPKASAPALKARSVYPADAALYCDLDIGEYMAFIAAFMPETAGSPLPQFAAMLKDAEPVTMAGYRNNGRLMCSVNVPSDLLAKVGQLAMQMQMQQMQQAQPPAASVAVPPSTNTTGAVE